MTHVACWGNSAAVRIPKDAQRLTGLEPGTPVKLDSAPGKLIITIARPSYTIEELLEGATPEAVSESWNWGEDVGMEIM